MAKKSNYKAKTIRLPPDVMKQVEMRADLNRRSFNSEIEYLICRALDKTVTDDFGLQPDQKPD